MNMASLSGAELRTNPAALYDHLASQLRSLLEGGVDFLLVGDSVAMVLLGYRSTSEVSMDGRWGQRIPS